MGISEIYFSCAQERCEGVCGKEIGIVEREEGKYEVEREGIKAKNKSECGRAALAVGKSERAQKGWRKWVAESVREGENLY